MYTNIILTIITIVVILFLLEIIKIRKFLQNNNQASSLYTNDNDELYEDAKDAVIEEQNASITFLQRRLGIGYARAAHLMDMLEENNIVGVADGSKPRKILSNNKN